MRFLAFVKARALAVFLVLAACLAMLTVSASPAALQTALHEAIHKAEQTERVSFLNDRARDITGATAVNAPGFIVPGGLTGEGQIVALADSGLDTGDINNLHPDLQSVPGKMPKVVMLKSWAGRDVPDDPDGHGTHMAATIAGTGAASGGKFRGIAPGASIYFQAVLDREGQPRPPDNLADLFWPAYSAGARIHVDGWGSSPNTYGKYAAQVDEFMRGHPDFLVVFGAGNSGPAPSTITAEANSKNALAVGASVLPRPALVPGDSDTAQAAGFSSRGPAGDGRIKPELLAPASAVISARSRLVEGNLPGYPDYTKMQGTSMAAAVAGGSEALLREYLKKDMGLQSPSAALLKAAMINGARPLPGGPSKDGFGIIDTVGTVIALKEGTFQVKDEWAGVAGGEELTYTFKVTDTTAPFKATLAWTDPAAEAGSVHSLVNDLDLIVRTPDGRMYYGNHFLGGNTPDRVNNVEQVFIPSPVPGDYTIQVAGAEIKQNTVSGSSKSVQDYALAWGQLPVETKVDKVENGNVKTATGSTFNLASLPVTNILDDSVTTADGGHIFPGAAVYLTGQRIYLFARLWRETGVSVLKTEDGYAFTEMNPVDRLGGYSMSAGSSGGITLNKNPVKPESLPPGFEINAVVNPREQKVSLVNASYIEQEGVVSSVHHENGELELLLAGSDKVYRISKTAAYSYEDDYIGPETEDTLFGTGALEELESVLPGVHVRLHLAPSSGEVQYLAAKRKVLFGTVVDASDSEVVLKNGMKFKIMTGAPVLRNNISSSLNEIVPGDHVLAVILSDTNESIGIVAYSNVLYGRAIDFTRTDRKLSMQDDKGRLCIFNLSQDAVIFRWGLKTTAEAIVAGSWIRVITDPQGNEILRLDIAETFSEKGKIVGYNENEHMLILNNGRKYRVDDFSSIYKNGYPVLPEDLLPGEDMDIEYAFASPDGYTVVSANARSTAPPPSLLVSAIPVRDQLVLTGRTKNNTDVYMVSEGNTRQKIDLAAANRFSLNLPYSSYTSGFTLVAIDRQSGGISGCKVVRQEKEQQGKYGVNGLIFRALSEARAEATGEGELFSLDIPVTRLEAVLTMDELFNWNSIRANELVYTDISGLPQKFHPALSDAQAMGVFKGYPDGSFLPYVFLNRAEAAVAIFSYMNELGLAGGQTDYLPYRDKDEIPLWAASAIAETTADGLFQGRPDGTFAPGEPVTIAEMGTILSRFLNLYETKLP